VPGNDGRFVSFDPRDDPDAALQKSLDGKDELHAGRTHRNTGNSHDESALASDISIGCHVFFPVKQRLDIALMEI
jgi:hypothetical protein